MRKTIVVFFIFFFLPLKACAISAETYIIIDADSGRIFEGKNIEKEKLIASTTKIMTAIIALENKDINTVVKVGPEVLKAYGSAIYITLNEEITLKDLLYGLMLRSGNDAAIEIAYATCGNMENFVKKMNEKAYELGMSHTTFLNNHGLEEDNGKGNTSTAYDMALLMKYALKNETFKEIIHTKSYTAKTTGKTYVWKNKNKLLFTYDKMLGGKTGYTKKALRTLVTAAEENGKTTIVVTLNDGNDFKDHQTLHEKILSNYERVELLNTQTVVDANHSEQYYLKENFYALLKPEEQKEVKIEFQLHESNTEEVGVANIYFQGKLLGSQKIYQKLEEKKAEKEGFFAKFFRWLFQW